MKKSKLFFVIMLPLALAVMFCGCKDEDLDLSSRVSDKRETLFDLKCDYGYFSYVGGVREYPYENDGKTGAMLDFGLVSFYPNISVNNCFDISLIIDEKEICLTLEKNPFENCLMADSKIKATNDSEIQISINDEIFVLNNKSKDFKFNSDDALRIANAELNLPSKIESNNNLGEIYVMLVFDKKNNFDNVFWYVAYFDGNAFESVMISTETGKVLARN